MRLHLSVSGLARPVTPAQVAAAAVAAGPFAVYLVLLSVVRPPGVDEWAQADPVLYPLHASSSVWLVAGLGLVAAAGWGAIARPRPEDLMAAAGQALLGVATAALIVGALRWAVGPTMPAFVPREEGSAPGFALSMAAGYGEEVVFRLALAPLLYLPLIRWAPRPVAIAVTALVVGLAFALLHEIGPADSSPVYFATRFLFPGAGMTVAFLAIGPSFLVAAHCTAHVVMPLLF